ncbi:MAG TPA: endonuclease [Bacilli bacterium]|nr:endonuclease [Bacilli bacterium]
MIKIKKTTSLTLITMLMSLSLINSNIPVKVTALTPMPTSVNVSDNSQAEINAYYEGVEGKKGDELLGELYSVIKDHNEYDYDNTTHRFIYKIIDRNWALSPLTPAQLQNFDYSADMPYIRKLYADYNDDVTTADLFKNAGASRVSFDKEHIWAQSLGNFGRTGGAGSDFHHLLPADVRGNQVAHSNYNFATPTSGVVEVMSDKGTSVGRYGYISGSSQKVFEPLDQYKGDIARAMFYMTARYYEHIDVLHPKLTLQNGSPAALTASASQAGLAGDLASLLEWNKLDPVDEYEIHRNNLIYNNYQANRNPFIDFPEWADVIYDPTYTGDGASFGGDDPIEEPTDPEEPIEDVVTLTSISVARVGSKGYYIFDELNKSDFAVNAHYSDSTSKLVTNYKVTVDSKEVKALDNLGATNLKFSFTQGEISVTKEILIEVELSPIHYTIIGAVGVGLVIGLAFIPRIRRRTLKNIANNVKKTTKKHKK